MFLSSEVSIFILSEDEGQAARTAEQSSEPSTPAPRLQAAATFPATTLSS